MNELLIPLNEVTRGDVEGETFGDVLPRRLPAGDNYAADKKTVDTIRDEILPLMDLTRKQRAGLVEEWQAIRRMEMLIHDDGRKYMGRSVSYLPVYARLLHTQTSTLAKGLFPSDEYMDCIDRQTRDPELAKASKSYVQYEFERNAKLRKHIKVFLRQLKNYGTSPLKFTYRKETKYEGRTFNLKTATAGVLNHAAFARIAYEGLQVSTRSLFNWYVYPMTADNLEEATLVFEDSEVPRAYVEQKLASKQWLGGDEALVGGFIPEAQANKSDLAETFNVSADEQTRSGLGHMLRVTEVWTFLKLPKSAYVPGENTDCPVPVCIILSGNTPVVVIRNPYFHQRPPYLCGRLNSQPGMFYGYGVGRISRHLQYLTNDFANQTNDCGSYSLNPIGVRNPALVAGPMRPIAPGVVWDFTDIEAGFKFERPPVELISAGMSMAQLFMGWTQELGGAPPQLSGINSGGSKTATGMQILQRNALSPLQDEVEDIEQDILIPLMYGTWMNGQQFLDREKMVRIAGEDIKITPESLAIDAEFRWLASSQAINAQQRSQQAIQLLQAVMPMAQYMNQLGYVVDPAPLLQRVFSDGMGFRNFDSFIRKAQMMPGGMGMPGQPLPAEAQQGVAAEQGDRVRSALEQAGGEYGGIVPGEGDAFMDTRAEADEIAAMLGQTYGQGG